jgi:hypothetical protein
MTEQGAVDSGNGEACNINDAPLLTQAMSLEEEREQHAQFVSEEAVPAYRAVLGELHEVWRGFNEQHFEGRLEKPHLLIDRTAARSLGHCSRTTGYGGLMQISFHPGLGFGSKSEWVVRPWPAQGTRRLIEDLLLRLTVRQYVLEVLKVENDGYRNVGGNFVAVANDIGAKLNLEPVARRRRSRDRSKKVASGWPHCVQPPGYYGKDVTEAAVRLACGCGAPREAVAPPGQGALELLAYLLNAGRAAEAQRLVNEHLERRSEAGGSRMPRRRQVESGSEDTDGMALGEVTFKVGWIDWNGGTVLRMARSIHKHKCFWELPLLADALVEAGCTDERILRHLRERMVHTRGCWVLRGLLGLEGD